MAIDYGAVPYTIFTDPELAGVGLTEKELMKKLGRSVCRTLELSAVPKAIIKGRTEGVVKLVMHPETKHILGVHVLAPNAGEIISQAMLMLKNKMTIYDALVSIEYFNVSTAPAPAKTVTFTLDNNGNILAVSDSTAAPNLLYTYTYDKLNRIDRVGSQYNPFKKCTSFLLSF